MQTFAEYLTGMGKSHNTVLSYTGRVKRWVSSGLHAEEFAHCGKLPEARQRFAALSALRDYQLAMQRRGTPNADFPVCPDLSGCRVKNPKAEPVPHLSQKQCRVMLDRAADIGPRTGLLFALLYGQGLRISEALDVRVDQVDLKSEVLWVDGKTGPREMPLMPFVARAIARWMQARAPLAALGEARLLVGPMGRRLHDKLARRVVLRMLKHIGLTVPVKRQCHLLRHAFARHCWEQGMDIRLIQTWLGHAELKTTERYIGVSQLRMMQARDHHPLADGAAGGLSVVGVPMQTDHQRTAARCDTA